MRKFAKRPVPLGFPAPGVDHFCRVPLDIFRPLTFDDVACAVRESIQAPLGRCLPEDRDSFPARTGYGGVPPHLVESIVLEEVSNRFDLGRANARVSRALALDPEIIHVMERACGTDAPSGDGYLYARVWREMNGLREVMRSAPHLLPVAYAAIVNGQLWGGEGTLQELKQELHEAGLSRAGWKEMLIWPRHWIDSVIPLLETVGFFATFVSTFEAVRTLAREGHVNFLEALIESGGSLRAWPLGALRAAAREASCWQADGKLAEFLQGPFTQVGDWLSEAEPRITGTQEKAGWRWLAEQQAIWQNEMFANSEMPALTWESALPEFIEGEYRAIALTTSAMLFDEGRAMHHCIASYDAKCARGRCRIFSIMRVGGRKHLATVELVLASAARRWKLKHVVSACNNPVSKDVREFAENLTLAYTDAWANERQ